MEEISDAKLGMHILELEITDRCNLNCKHCYNKKDRSKNIDMPFSKIKEFIGFTERNKVKSLIISGGEPILHPQFNELADYISKNRKYGRVVLQTNGTTINFKTIKSIKHFSLIHISYDESENVRKNAGENLNVAKFLKKNGVDSYLFATITKGNAHLIDSMVNNATNAGIKIGFNTCLPAEDVDEKFLMSNEELFQVEKKLFNLSENKKILRFSSPLTAIFSDNKKTKKFIGIKGGCTAGVAGCLIASNGEVFPCPFMRVSVGNAYAQNLSDIWLKSKILNEIRDRKSFAQPCRGCEFLSYCGGCRNRSFKSSGDLKGPDPRCYLNNEKRSLKKANPQ